MRHAREDSSLNIEQVIDLVSAVQQFHGIASRELKMLLRDSENFSLQQYTEKGLLVRAMIDVEKLAWSLPMHLMAVLISPSKDDFRLQHLLSGFRFLHSLCDLASRHAKLEQILFDELKVSEQILDMVFHVLIFLACYKLDNHASDFLPLLHSTLVACSFHILAGYVPSQSQEDLANVLLSHSKGGVFIDVAFSAVHLDIDFLQIKLSALTHDIVSKKSNPVAAEKVAHSLCQQIEASLQFLHSLCQQKVFREWLLKNKELCQNGGILSMAWAVLKLDVMHFRECPKVAASISRSKSKVLSILLLLCETESISYLDDVASSPRSMQLAKSVTIEVVKLLKTGLSRNDYYESSCPSGLVLLNSMLLLDVFSDDSNFQNFIIANITNVLAEMLSLPHEEFTSSWCSTDDPLMEEDASLNYEPFVAAGAVLVSVSAGLGTPETWKETNTGCSFSLNSLPPASYAQQRTSLLVKIIANLHCYLPNICEEQERDLFFNKFLECLPMEVPKSTGFPVISDIRFAATVCKNLGSLLYFATSLIPNFLNEDDVDLLRKFVKQFQALIIPQIESDSIQEQVRENKLDSHGSGKFCNSSVGECHQVNQGRMRHASSMSAEIDSKLLEVALNARKFGNLKEGTSENSPYQNEEMGKSKGKAEMSRSPSESLREVNKDVQNVETSGSDASSTGGKNSGEQVLYNGGFSKLADRIKEGTFRRVEENEKTTNREEKQQRKRKRNIMNDKQITIIEKALLEEPDMQRNAASLQSWADKLSAHGSDLTASQLKNWLNNRKARLARTKVAHVPLSEGESSLPERPGGVGQERGYDSPGSPTDEFQGRCEPGQYVLLLDMETKEVAKAKVYQVEGEWHGKNLEQERTCIADIVELKADRRASLPHPSEAAGATFDEAESRFGVMRVAWDTRKIFILSQ